MAWSKTVSMHVLEVMDYINKMLLCRDGEITAYQLLYRYAFSGYTFDIVLTIIFFYQRTEFWIMVLYFYLGLDIVKTIIIKISRKINQPQIIINMIVSSVVRAHSSAVECKKQ